VYWNRSGLLYYTDADWPWIACDAGSESPGTENVKKPNLKIVWLNVLSLSVSYTIS